jgi:hypothetical protein
MAESAPAQVRVSSERYLRLVDEGVLQATDRVELLEGVVVAMSPISRDDRVETFRVPDAGQYRERATLRRGDRIEVGAFAGTTIEVSDLLPERPGSTH